MNQLDGRPACCACAEPELDVRDSADLSVGAARRRTLCNGDTHLGPAAAAPTLWTRAGGAARRDESIELAPLGRAGASRIRVPCTIWQSCAVYEAKETR
jgi:hypothetical protein